jgi:lipopolysaccharide export system protein LptA
MCADRRLRRLAAVLCAIILAAPGRAQLPDLATQTALPIDLDAASSEFDRRNNRLVFQHLHIRQGSLSVTANVGEATRLDFENSRWTFKGNVIIDNQGARVFCDDAELLFVGHALRSAKLRGAPARFEQQRPDAPLTQGRAGAMDYDVVAAIIRLSQDAWLSDGAR